MRRALDIVGMSSPSREFPEHAATLADPVSRRDFLGVMGASPALAGVTGCNMRQPHETLVPYVKKPKQ